MKTRYLISFVLALWASALSAQSHWSFDYQQYQYGMSVYFDLQRNRKPVQTDQYEVAAFVGDECRGVASFESQTGSNGTTLDYGFMKVYSNIASGEEVVFKCYDKSKMEEIAIPGNVVTFASDDAVGLPSQPMALGFVVVKLGDVNADEKINATDVRLLINRRFNRPVPAGFFEEACDINGDGRINATDVRLIINLRFGR